MVQDQRNIAQRLSQPIMATSAPGFQDGQPQEQQAPPQMTREQFRDEWMSAGQMTPQAADDWMRAHGATQAAGGEKAGRWNVPGGGMLDTQIGRGGAVASGGMITPGWTPVGGGGGSAPGGGVLQTGGGFMAPGGDGSAANFAVYKPGQLPTAGLSTYTPGALNQFGGVDQGEANKLQQQALMQALQSGGSMNPGVVSQMKGQQQEMATSLAEQAQQQALQSAASRGVSGGGVQGAQSRRINDARDSALLGGFRDIDINAAQTNFGDQLKASGALDTALGRQAGTAMDAFQTSLSGQLAQEQLGQQGVASQNDAVRFALERALAQEGLQQTAAGMGEGRRQFDVGLGENARQFDRGLTEGGRQFDVNQGFLGRQLGEQGRQFNMGYGLSAAELQRKREQDALALLFGGA